MPIVTTSKQKRPFASVILIILVVFLGISAAPAGISLLLDPSGAGLGMSADALQGGPFPDYLIPGLFLFLVLGLWSLLIAFCLWKRPQWSWTRPLIGWTGRHWSWAAALLQGIVLMIWIIIQVAIIGYDSVLQPIYFVLGLVIAILCLLPSVRAFYAES